MTRGHSLEESQEQAALYALGALPREEAESFEAHLRSGCDACKRELASFGAVVEELAAATPPSERVRAAVMRRFATPVLEEGGIRFVRAAQVAWRPALPAVATKSLFRDRGRGYNTQLVRMEAGGTYPPHRHVEAEEIYIIEGDLTVSGVTMHAGDYCRAEADSVHDRITTRDGCVFLVLSSEHDELLA